jgi:hypothetical protein
MLVKRFVQPINHLRVLMAGESYWKIRLPSGKTLSELDTKPIEVQGKRVLMRRLEWKEDLIDSGDIRHVQEVMLVTPQGTAGITVVEPYTCFQLARGTLAYDGEQGKMIRLKNAQIIGVVTDKETGTCEYAVWDIQAQQIYTGQNNVLDFSAWREGIVPVGRLNLEAMDVRL